jgi:hypothetical protein
LGCGCSGLAELFGRPDGVARLAQAPHVVVGVLAALRYGQDVVRHGCSSDSTIGPAVSAQRFLLEPAQAQRHTSPTTHAHTRLFSRVAVVHGHGLSM